MALFPMKDTPRIHNTQNSLIEKSILGWADSGLHRLAWALMTNIRSNSQTPVPCEWQALKVNHLA